MNATISKFKFLLLAFAALTVVHCSKGGGGSSDSSAATTTSCPANQIYTTGAGCLPTCGVNMVYYNNQCVSSYSVTAGNNQTCNPTYVNGVMTCSNQTGFPQTGFPQTGYPQTGQNICTGSCGAGQVQSVMNGQVVCLPQGQCGACYGQNNGWCYIGVNAHMYYGY